mmetsp:Transcript_2738/g.4678  ORF Transcript_2738/g.4678 Transcript_2738/m.4678 type:complete len:159 (-) Transcript_2738:297-773(-)
MFTDLDKPEQKERLTSILQSIKKNIEEVGANSPHQQLALTLFEQYGESDIGILFAFFLNILKLKRGESFVITPDEPHAYISGDLIEAMVNSDNVVRGGLTPKLKDTETLINMLKYEFKDRSQVGGNVTFDQGGARSAQYKTGFDEFMVTHLSFKGDSE